MLNLEPRNETRVQTPEEDNKILFLNEDGDLVLKDDAGDIKYVTISDVKPPKVYKALLTQNGTDAPTAIVLENTLGGEVVWTRTGAGEYWGTLVGAFTGNKTFTFISNPDIGTANDAGVSSSRRSGDDVILISTLDSTFGYSDSQLSNSPILIEVYS